MPSSSSSLSSACFFINLVVLERPDMLPTIRDFLVEEQKTMQFPASLAASTRKILHQLGESLGLCHKSHGYGAARSLCWSKPRRGLAPWPEVVRLLDALVNPHDREREHQKESDHPRARGAQPEHEFHELPWEQWERHLRVGDERLARRTRGNRQIDVERSTEASDSASSSAGEASPLVSSSTASSFSSSLSSSSPSSSTTLLSLLSSHATQNHDVEPTAPAFRSNNLRRTPASQRRDRREPCRYFNQEGGCSFAQHCRWRHACWHCEGQDGHPGFRCPHSPNTASLYEKAASAAFQRSPILASSSPELTVSIPSWSSAVGASFSELTADEDWVASSFYQLQLGGRRSFSSGSDGSPPFGPVGSAKRTARRSTHAGGLLFVTLPLELLMEGVLPFLAQDGPADLLSLTETCHLARILLSSDHVWHSRFLHRYRTFRPIRMKLRRTSSEGPELAVADTRGKAKKNGRPKKLGQPCKRNHVKKKSKKKKAASPKLPAVPDDAKWKTRYRARYEEQLAYNGRKGSEN
eukprot:g8617.t1